MITLCIDEGNTSAKVGLFAGEIMVKFGQFEDNWSEEIKQFIGHADVTNVMVCSTKEDYDVLDSYLDGYKVHYLKDVTKIPLELDYDTPHTLGKDRVISAYAATHLFPDEHCAIFNIGTCMTLDFLERGPIFRGGNISPGLSMRLQAMHEHTAQLPWVEINTEVGPLGKTTETALQNGAFLGMLYEIQGFIISLRQKHTQVRVMLTGGNANYFANRLEKSIFVDPFLNLKGLHYLSKHHD